jgi:hypothetical protein
MIMETRTVFTGVIFLMALLSFEALAMTSVLDYACGAIIIIFTSFALIAYIKSCYEAYKEYKLIQYIRSIEEEED